MDVTAKKGLGREITSYGPDVNVGLPADLAATTDAGYPSAPKT